MNRLVFLVEGDSELYFVKNLVTPYLYEQNIHGAITCQKITTNRKLNISGGNVSYTLFTNELDRIYSQGNVVVTTLLDFFRLPNDFPEYHTQNPDRIQFGMLNDKSHYINYFPYIQMHEFEALFYSDIENFELFIENNDQRLLLLEILNAYNNPELINTHPDRYPARRLKNLIGYSKGSDAELIIDCCKIETIIAKCPRFSDWINNLIDVMKAN